MKALTVRLPEALVAEIEAKSRARERLSAANGTQRSSTALPNAIADLIGSVDGLPDNLSSTKRSTSRRPAMEHRR